MIGSVDDEAEALLSLLSDDFGDGDECFHVRKETKKSVRKPVLERREDNGFCNECGPEKSRVDSGASARFECDSVVSRKKDRRNREEKSRKEEAREALLKRDSRNARVVDVKRDALSIKDVRDAQEVECGGSSRKTSRISDSSMRKENWRAEAGVEEDGEEFSRREEQKRRVRRDGSSCSSYYSLSSNGDYDSDYDVVQFGEGRVSGDSSSNAYKRNSRSNEVDYLQEEDTRVDDSREDRVVSLARKINEQEYHGSTFMESDFRKKSEKKLTDNVSIEETESKKGTVSKTSVVEATGDVKLKHYSYAQYDDRKLKSTESSKLDVEKKHLHRQRNEQVSRQSETRVKHHKQFVDTHNVDITTSYGSENKVYTGTDEKSVKTTHSSRLEEIKEKQTGVRHLSTTENISHRNPLIKVSKSSEAQDIDVRKASSSQQKSEVTAYGTEKDHYDEVRKLEEFRGKSRQSDLIQDKSSSTLNKKSRSELISQEENENNFAYVSSFGSEEQISSQSHDAKVIRRGDFRTSRLTNTSSITESGEHNMTSSQTLIGQTGAALPFQQVESTGERLQLGSAASHGYRLERSTALQHHHEGDGGQPSKFTSLHEEGAIESAAQSQKSSAIYIGEIVDKVRQEIMSSESEKEMRTFQTKLVHEEEQHDRKSYGHNRSESSQSEKNGLKRGAIHSSGTTKGPSDEMWKVDEPLVQEVREEDANTAGNVVVKRTGRSLWNIIGDVVRLRWSSSRSESQSTGGKTGGRSSPNQSTTSETWFSGHEAEENEEATTVEIEKESNELQEPLFGKREEVRSKEGAVSSTNLKLVGTSSTPSSSVPNLEISSGPSRISSPFTKENYSGDASAVVESSISLPKVRLRRSPIIRSVSERGETNVPESGIGEQPYPVTKQSDPAVSEGEQSRKKLHRKDQVSRDRFDEWEEAYKLDSEQRKIDEIFMREALLEAQKAADNWEVPVGAVLVHNGKIIARGYNLVEELRDSTAHAEMICIREASNTLRTWRLSETTLYVTLEPCPMCAGAILQARIDTVVWGAPNKLLGADGSWIRLFPNGGDGGNGLDQNDDKPAAPVHPFHPKIIVRRGVLASECADAMQQFFQLRRKKKEKKPESPSRPSCLPVSHHHPSKFLTKMHDAFHIMFCL